MLAYLEPIDTLFFRDNRPMEAGTDTFAECILPSPLTFYGAIGSYFLGENGTDVDKFLCRQIEDPTLGWHDNELKSARLKVKGVFLFWNGTVYLPPPANLLRVDDGHYWAASPEDQRKFEWDIAAPELLPLNLPRGECKPIQDYVSLREMRSSLLKRCGEMMHPEQLTQPIYAEQRFGHRIDRATLVVKENFLYATTHLRFKEQLIGEQYTKLKFLVALSNVEGQYPADGVALLGGEGKRVRLTLSSEDLQLKDDEILSEITRRRRFFVYLLTPAIFNGGWRRETWPGEFQGATLVGAAVNKPIYLSGWKREKSTQGIPRPIKKAVPEGAVYFFQARSWDEQRFSELYETYNFNSSLSEEYPCAGFGISLIGAW